MKIKTCSHDNKPILTDDQVSKGFVVADITIKSGCDIGWVMAPTWEMVNAIKRGTMPKETFTKMYYSLMNFRWDRLMPERLEAMRKMNLILMCYCPEGQFCHRYLAADFLVNREGATYYGEHQTS